MSNIAPRKLPYSIEAEQSVLGCILISDTVASELCSSLKKDDFESEIHKKIFESMQNLSRNGQPIDYVTLVSELEKVNKLNEIGGLNYITDLTNTVPTAANYKHYADIVLENSKLRKLNRLGDAITSKTFDGENSNEIIEFVEKQLTDIVTEKNRGLLHIGDSVNEVIKKFQEIAKNPNAQTGLKTGYWGLDKALNGGLQKGGLFLLAARPGVGKTSLAMNIVTNCATQSNAICAVFSLEMTTSELAQRALCSVALVESKKALNAELTPDDWTQIWEGKKKLCESNIHINDSSSVTVAQIVSECQKLKREKGLDLVLIDYVQLMNSSTLSKSVENRQQEVSNFTRGLKNAAKELDVPILLLSQLSRAPEQRTDHRPMLADLRESGAIEQDADAVMFIYNPDKYAKENEPKPGIVELIVAKNRHGETPTIKLRFVDKYATFMNLNAAADAISLEKNMPQFAKKILDDEKKNSSNVLTPIDDGGSVDDIFD